MTDRDPADLRQHAQRKRHITLPEDDPRYLSLVDDIKECGFLTPILITPDNQIVDGVLRWRAAKRLQLKSIPVTVIPDEDVNAVIVRVLVHRRHYTKGALTYVCQPLLADAYADAQKESSRVTRRCRVTLLDSFLQQLGFSQDSYQHAAYLHEVFEAQPEFRAKFEGDLLSGDSGLGHTYTAVRTLIAQRELEAKGYKHGGGRPKATEEQFKLFIEAFKAVKTRFKYWENFNIDQQEKGLSHMCEAFQVMPKNAQESYLRRINKLRKQGLQKPI